VSSSPPAPLSFKEVLKVTALRRLWIALIAVYVRDVLKGGSSLFGILGSLVGFGMILGTQLVRQASRNR